MAFTITDLATELGIDAATLQAKPDAVAKWNGYLSQADTQYREAKEAVEQAKRDQSAIDTEIQKFGMTESRVAELESANAAYKAALDKAKESGLNIDLSGIRQPTAAVTIDPTKTLQDTMRTGFTQMGEALRVQARYQAVFGKPFVDDPVSLVDEAIAARMPVAQYAEQKYKFAAETTRQDQAALQTKIDAGVTAGVAKWQEDHPVTRGNPGLAAGLASKHPGIFKPRTSQETKDFRKMPVRDRIAASVSRAKESLASAAE